MVHKFKSAIRCWFVLATALSAVASIHACSPVLNWFPKAADVSASITRPVYLANNSLSETECTGPSMSCAFPDAWLPTSQNAAKNILPGYSAVTGGPFKVAIKNYGVEPRIYFIPSSPLLQQDADVTACVSAAGAAVSAATRRRGLQATIAGLNYTVTTPGTWSYSVKYGNGSAYQGEKVGSAGVIRVSSDSQGEECATVTVTINGHIINNSAGNVFVKPVPAVHKVCWYRENSQAKAKFVFDPASTCKTGAVSINVSSIFPLAQNLTQNGSNVVVGGEQQLLFQPVLHIWGALNTTLDGTVLTELQYDDQNQAINYINKYVFLPSDMKPTDKLTFDVDDGKLLTGELEEGYYRLSAKVSVMTRFPDIVDLQGRAVIAQTDVGVVQGYTEYMSMLAINGSDMAVPMQPVQLNTTHAAISSISSNKIGREIAEGDNITFSWQFVGTGSQQCFHDEVLLPGRCASPMTVAAKAVASGSSISHVFRVAFTDVCGNEKNASYMYTQNGVTALTKIDYIPVTASDTVTTSTTASPISRTKSSAGTGPAHQQHGLANSVFARLMSLLMIVALAV